MNDFFNSATNWLVTVADHADKHYSVHKDFIRDGRLFPLFELLEIRSHHPILSIRTEKGRWGVSTEQCYFDICESLNTERLSDYLAFLKKIQEKDVDYRNPEHDYTLLSLVVVTNNLTDPSLIRTIKRFRSEKQYHVYNGEFGWSSCRLCTVDLSSGRIICSVMGDTLKKRLSQ